MQTPIKWCSDFNCLALAAVSPASLPLLLLRNSSPETRGPELGRELESAAKCPLAR